MPAFDHFGFLAPIYERVISPPDPQILKRLLAPKFEFCLLDTGGGTGRVAQHFRGLFRKVIVMDVSLGMLRQAQLKRDLDVCQGSVLRLPFEEGTFERVVAVDSFHHFPDQGAAARELVRVLKPGGRLVIEEPNIEHFRVKLIALGEWVTLMGSHFYEPRELVNVFSPFDVTVEVQENSSFNYWAVIRKF